MLGINEAYYNVIPIRVIRECHKIWFEQYIDKVNSVKTSQLSI